MAEQDNKCNYIDDLDGEQELVEIDFRKYWDRIWLHRKTIIWWTAAAFVFGCVVALLTPRKYVVSTKLAPELSVSYTSRMSSLASMLGTSATLMGTTDAVYPMVYPDILKSPEFLVDLFDVNISFKEKKEVREATLYEYLTEHQKQPIMALPMKAIGAVMSWILPAKEDEDGNENEFDSFHLTKKQGRLVRGLEKRIQASVDKKTLSLTVSVTMNDALACATLAKAVNEQLRRYVTDYRTNKVKKDRDFYEKILEESRQAYYDALSTYSAYADSHQGITLQSCKIEGQRLKNEADLKYQLYSTMSQQFQNAQAKVQQETPVFAELITPTVPLRSANSRKKTALAFAFVGGVAGVAWVLWKYRKMENEE